MTAHRLALRFGHAAALLAPSALISPALAQSQPPAPASAPAAAGPADDRCSNMLNVAWPDPQFRLEHAAHVAAQTVDGALIPAHCEMTGIGHERTGVDGQAYAIRFHLRLPDDWNGRMFFQGGGGSNGELGDAYGRVSSDRGAFARPPAIAMGYAVVSQDSGHANALNTVPARGGPTAFGFDPEARANYGHASLAPVTLAAKAAITTFYHRPIARAYFYGCSKGGEEGMVLAQQHPDLFDGIVAAAPGFALPRAAVEEAFQVQTLARLLPHAPGQPPRFADFAHALTPAQLGRVSDAVLGACDALDGARDGIVANLAACTTARVRPALDRIGCEPKAAAGDTACLTTDQRRAMLDLMAGARRADGRPVYAAWAWDPGLAAPGWAIWKIGSPDGHIPALNVVLGGASLRTVFTVPPQAVAGDPQTLFAAQLAFDVKRDGEAIYATGGDFTRSGWDDSSAHSPDLTAFARHGGRLIVPHGVADPVFSVNDTIDWWQAVDRRLKGHASDTVRVFPVPGMNHCTGGPATDQFDSFGALVQWVEGGQAPASITATAGAGTPWPGRTRPLCPFPRYARYRGHGSLESAASFACVDPARRHR